MKLRISLLGGLLSISAAVPAYADLEVGAGLNFTSKDDVTILSPKLRAEIPLAPMLTLEAAWGLSYATGDGESEFTPHNPFVAAHFGFDLGMADVRVGAGLSLPVFRTNDFGTLILRALASAQDGGWNIWMYTPEAYVLAIPARVRLTPPGIKLTLEGALFTALDGGDVQTDTLEFGMQLGGEVMIAILPVLDLGARVQAVWGITDDYAQISAEPFAQIGVGPAWVRLGFLMNLDEPYGFAFDDGGIWAVRASFGIGI